MRLLALVCLLVACNGGSDTDTDTDTNAGGGALINEYMASNATAWADEDGSFPDWVELYNPTDAAVSLDGATFSDDPTDPAKWAFPADASVHAGGFLLVICDGDAATQGGLHTSFKLSASGESLVLTGPAGEAWDALDYGTETSDVSTARSPDGGPQWVPDATPTPGTSNQ